MDPVAPGDSRSDSADRGASPPRSRSRSNRRWFLERKVPLQENMHGPVWLADYPRTPEGIDFDAASATIFREKECLSRSLCRMMRYSNADRLPRGLRLYGAGMLNLKNLAAVWGAPVAGM